MPRNVAIHARTADPASFYEAADLLLNLPRVDLWMKNFGMTLVEAMAFGLPVIAPPVGGPVEIVTHGRDGWLMDSQDDALKAAVARLADDPELRLRMGAAASDRARDFSFRAIRGPAARRGRRCRPPFSVMFERAKKREMLKVAIVGTVGVPGRYGGFETLADNLVRQMSADVALTSITARPANIPMARCATGRPICAT